MMERLICHLHRCSLCIGGTSQVLQGTVFRNSQFVRQISTTSALQRKKMTRKYNPKVRPFNEYGDTHRLVRGLDASLSRYGPLVDKPDYTFLDGRPTPLTPEQMQERETRKGMAETVVQYMKEMKEMKTYASDVKPKLVTEERKRILDSKLKAKS